MKKLFSLVLAVAMVLSMACFASAEENTTLTIVAWDVGTTPYYQAQKEAFEATHPGVTIEYVDVASQDWDTAFRRRHQRPVHGQAEHQHHELGAAGLRGAAD